MPARDWSENWKGGDQFEDLNVDERIVTYWVSLVVLRM
jgi:hypothetical protein